MTEGRWRAARPQHSAETLDSEELMDLSVEVADQHQQEQEDGEESSQDC
jgi:hypothetical protein